MANVASIVEPNIIESKMSENPIGGIIRPSNEWQKKHGEAIVKASPEMLFGCHLGGKIWVRNRKTLRRNLRRALKGKVKLPRKLKKAFTRYIFLDKETTPPKITEKEDGTIICTSTMKGWQIKPGYPHTKWARKAEMLINRRSKNISRYQINLKFYENYQRNPGPPLTGNECGHQATQEH